MIVTLTPNPSVDRTLEIDELVRGAVVRATGVRVDAGGKGVNVSRALAANGIATKAVLPVGGTVGELLWQLLPTTIEVVPVRVAGELRANVSLVEPDGAVTKLNEPGPWLTETEVEDLLAVTVSEAVGSEWLVVCGSLPPGAPADLYRRLLDRVPGRVAVDASGTALELALVGEPWLIKPNRAELAEAAGLPVTTVGEAVSAARSLCRRGAHAVLATLGSDGALLVQGADAWFGEAAVDSPVSAVGAGDATLAGFLAGGGRGVDALREAIAWGAAAVSLPGSQMPGPRDLDRSAVHIAATVPFDRDLKGH